MKTKTLFIAVLTMLCAAVAADQIIVEPIAGLPEDFIRGADISMLSQIEECGGKYYDKYGKEADLFDILKDNGVNWIRLRLWHNPVNLANIVENKKVISKRGEPAGGGNNDLERTVGMAKRAKAAGFKLLLDFHYSDTWADPGKQIKPAAWRKHDFKELQQAVYDYTADVMQQLTKAGACPDMVQVGNELNNGMIWPDGKIWGDTGEEVGGMDNFIKLLEQGIKAVRKETPRGKEVKIAIHLADGGNNALYRSIFDPISKKKLDYDVIGLSYYPYWHGSLDDLKANVSDLVKRYKKEIIIAETAYAFTEDDGDEQGNVFQIYSDEKHGYKPSVQGQATVVRDVMASVLEAGGNKALGIFYWEPAWILAEGAGWRTGSGNNWENQAMFDYTGKALESLSVFKRVYDSAKPEIKAYSYEEPKVKVVIGTQPVLPASVKVILNDDSLEAQEVAWDKHDFSKETAERTFKLNGKIKASGFPVTAEVTASNKINLVTDSSWESGELGEWKLNGNPAYCFVENNKSNAYTGSWTYKYWWSKPFKSVLTRTFRDIPNGNYTLSVWAMGGGGENSIKLFATNFGSGKTPAVLITNTGWKAWKQYTLPNINVTNNECTIGISLDANDGNWGNFDDVEFYLEPKK